MGRMKENPRYNVISLRVSDEELESIEKLSGNNPRSEFLLAAVVEKIQREEEARFRSQVERKLKVA